jgi:hypothetical protein
MLNTCLQVTALRDVVPFTISRNCCNRSRSGLGLLPELYCCYTQYTSRLVVAGANTEVRLAEALCSGLLDTVPSDLGFFFCMYYILQLLFQECSATLNSDIFPIFVL